MKRRALLGATCGLLGDLLPFPARAELDHRGIRLRLGPPRSPHAMVGGDAGRSRRAATRLSPRPRVQRRLRVAFGVGRGMVVSGDGSFFVSHPSARASRFDSQGKLLFSLKLPAEASSAPVVTSAAAFALLAAGELHLIDASGRVRAQTAIGEADLTARSILATSDAGVVLATSGFLTKLSVLGELAWRRAAPEPPLELLETAQGLLLVTRSGSIYAVDAAGRLNKLGDFAGPAQSVTSSVDGAHLLARSGAHRLVSFDLRERRLSAAIEDPTLEIDGPVLLSREGLAQSFTSDGLLMRYRPDGSEAQRILIDPGARKAPGQDDALLLEDGRLLLARPGADVALVTPAGEVSTISGSSCPDPIGLVAAGSASVLLASRSGTVFQLA